MKNRVKGILCMLFAVVLILCIAAAAGSREAYAADAHVSGSVYASAYDGVDTLYLDGDTTLNRSDGDDVTIKMIRFNDNGSTRNLTVTGSNAGTLRITGNGTSDPVYMYSTSSSLNIQGGHIIVGDGNTFNSSSTYFGIIRGGSVRVTEGILEIKASGTSEYFYGITTKYFGVSSNAIVNVDVTGTYNVTGIEAGEINLTGGNTVVRAESTSSQRFAKGIASSNVENGHWYISGADVSATAISSYNSYGMYTLPFGNSSGVTVEIEGDSSVTAYGTHYGFYTSYNDWVKITGNSVVKAGARKKCAFFCTSNLTVGGNGVLSAYWDDLYATTWNGTVYVGGDLYISSSKIVEPEGGYRATNGDHNRFIVDSSGNTPKYVRIAPNSNSNVWGPSKIFVDGGRYFASDRLYYVNGATATGAYTSDWNAHYEPETGTLYLRGYNGSGIGIMRGTGYSDKKLTVDLVGNNYIDTTGQFGIEADANDLEITSVNYGNLYITGEYSNGSSAAAIATAGRLSSISKGKLIISGDAYLYIEAGSNGAKYGLRALKDIIIKDHSIVDVNVYYGKNAQSTFYGMGTTKNITITTDNPVNVSIYPRDNWEGNDYKYIYALYLPNYIGANGSSRFNLINAEYVSISYVGFPAGHVMHEPIRQALLNGLVPEYQVTEFSGNDAKSMLIRAKDSQSVGIPITGAYFPDPAFRQGQSYYDSDGDGWFSQEEIDAVTYIQMNYNTDEYYRSIHSIAGMEWFTKLQYLIWDDGCLRTVELPANGQQSDTLQSVQIRNNLLETVDLEDLDSLTGLDITSNTNLEWSDVHVNSGLELLDASYCGFGAVDISGLPELLGFGCLSDALTSLDVSNNTKLQMLYCADNSIDSLDVSDHTDLWILQCENNDMETLTLGSHPNMGVLYCYGNDLDTLDIGGAPLIKEAYLNGTHEAGQYFEYYYKEGGELKVDGTTAIETSAPVASARLKAANLTLEGKISINFKIATDSSGLVARFYYEKAGFAQVAEVPLDSAHFVADSNGDYYLVSYTEVPAKEMTQTLRIKVFDAFGNQVPMQTSSGSVDQYDYSVAKWCNNKITQNNNANDVMIAKALLNYGHYTQLALKYNDGVDGRPNRLANPNGYLAAEMASFSGGNSEYDSVTTGGPALGAKAFALVLESDTSIKLKLKRQVEVLIDGSAATLNPEVDSDGADIWAVYKTGVPAKKLHEKAYFKLTEGSSSATLQYGALSWANKKLTGSDVNDKNLAKAMYLYNYAARKYFNYDSAGL